MLRYHNQIYRYFLWKKMREAFAMQKLLKFFQQKILVYINIKISMFEILMEH